MTTIDTLYQFLKLHGPVDFEPYEHFINMLPGSTYFKNQDGRYVWCNTCAEEVMKENGFSSNILHKTDFSLFPKKIAEKYWHDDLETMSRDDRVDWNETVVLPNGQKLIQLSAKRAIRNKRGKLLGLIGITLSSSDDQFTNKRQSKLTLNCKYGEVSITNRELECLRYLCKGRTMKEIGYYLNISPRTVESYIVSLKSKLGCNFKSELINIASENHIE